MRAVHGKRYVAVVASAATVAAGSLAILNLGSAGATTMTPAGTDTTGAATGTGSQVAVIAGNNRVLTAIAVSKAAFPQAGSAKAVVLAQDIQFPDALAGGPLATGLGGPLLLSDPNTIDPATLAEIKRVLPAGGNVAVLGGTSAISASVANAITGAGFVVTRVAGVNRFATAVAIANVIKPKTVLVATGLNFPDALSAGPAAAVNHAAILLSNGSTQAAETSSYLSSNPTDTVYAVGGPASTADPTATALVGADRFQTATMVASKFFPSSTGSTGSTSTSSTSTTTGSTTTTTGSTSTGPKAIGLVAGNDFPDALSSVPLLGALDSPLILVNPTGPLPSYVSSYLTANPTIGAVIAFGGSSALSSSVISEVTSLLGNGGGGGTTTTTGNGTTTTTTGGGGGLGGLSSITSIISLLTGGLGGSSGGGITSLVGGLPISSLLNLTSL
ncbi:MAG: cell wall-binding repeat-containing protein [Acidimicrobiales bacterium]